MLGGQIRHANLSMQADVSHTRISSLVCPGNFKVRPGFEIINFFACSTQLSMKFQLLILTKMVDN